MAAISLNTKKLIKSLQVKKYRKEEQCFLVEGAKGIAEVIDSSFEIKFIAATPPYIKEHAEILGQAKTEVIVATERDLESAGSFQTNESAIAVVRMKPNDAPAIKDSEFVLVLDDIRDPGNLGTIMRTADWYGIRHIIASPETADHYNPKTIAASMGSFTRVHVFYTPLIEFLKGKHPVYGTFLDGINVHDVKFGDAGFLVIGNESNGVSKEVAEVVEYRIMIPRIGKAESLNAGVATAVILDNVRRLNK